MMTINSNKPQDAPKKMLFLGQFEPNNFWYFTRWNEEHSCWAVSEKHNQTSDGDFELGNMYLDKNTLLDWHHIQYTQESLF